MATVINPHASDDHARPWSGRYEDAALVTGHGRYSSDVQEGAYAAAFVRSPHAHAKINAISTETAAGADGVVAVLTFKDMEKAGVGSVSGSIPFPGRDGAMPVSPFRPALSGEKVMHVGEAVALVIAKTRAQANDAAELVEVDYDVLEPVVDLEAAKAARVQLWPAAPGNVTLDWTSPEDPDGARRQATADAMAASKHRVSVEVVNQRISAVTMEPRACTASYDKDSNTYTFHAGTQGVTGVAAQVAMSMGIDPGKLHMLSQDVGGGFGMKASTYPEYPALLAAAKIVGHPVHWVASRSEAFMTDNQARDSVWQVELGLDEDGRFRALKIEGDQNVGSYMTGVAVLIPTIHIAGCMPSVYDIAHVVVDSKCYFTNTVPTGPYRGAGRPEANHLLERVIDAAAAELKMDPAEIRKRNLIKPEQMPYPTTLGPAYDSGEFPAIFEEALQAADYAGFAARRKQSEKAGKLRGIGIAGFLEISGGHYHEPARVGFGDNKIVVSIGPTPQGQGHVTVFRQMVAKRLGLDDEEVEVTFGDSKRDVPGFGAVASRTAMLTGSAVAQSVDRMLEKAANVAATLLQADVSDIEYSDGAFARKGTGQTVTLFEAAERARDMVKQGAIEESLDTTVETDTGPSFPNGCHIAEVEIDPGTGEVDVVAYTSVSDVGIMLNERIVEGQIQGGIVSGIGQALGEFSQYDESGQPVSASFMDYTMQRAAHMPPMKILHHPVRCKTNYVGAKGVGESGTTGAPPTIVNAIENAIAPGQYLGLQMPVTPYKVWKAIREQDESRG